MTYINGQEDQAGDAEMPAEAEATEEGDSSTEPPADKSQTPVSSRKSPGNSMDMGKAALDPNKTILVVEDDIDTADSLKVKLESHGYNILNVFDGLQALETARKLRPGLIILDVMVPGLMGYHVCRLLKFDERYRNIPIIILTGKVDRESKEIGTKAGADIYMTKPFEMENLIEEVRKFIG